MTLYIAAPYPCKSHAQAIALACRAAGLTVTSRWLWEDCEESSEWAIKDLADIEVSDWLVALNPPDYHHAGTGGRHVELGYALARGKPVLLVGARSNIFHQHSDVVRIAEAEPEVIAALLASLGDKR